MEVALSDKTKKREADAKPKPTANPVKEREALTNEELDKVAGGRGSAPVKLPFEVED
jgi:hypothetical protein